VDPNPLALAKWEPASFAPRSTRAPPFQLADVQTLRHLKSAVPRGRCGLCAVSVCGPHTQLPLRVATPKETGGAWFAARGCRQPSPPCADGGRGRGNLSDRACPALQPGLTNSCRGRTPAQLGPRMDASSDDAASTVYFSADLEDGGVSSSRASLMPGHDHADRHTYLIYQAGARRCCTDVSSVPPFKAQLSMPSDPCTHCPPAACRTPNSRPGVWLGPGP
jgi:hypothetical protein